MAAWADNAAAVAAPAPARRARPRSKPAPRKAARRPERPALFGGVVWIALLAVLLAGIVALNVAVLEATVRLDELAREKAALRDANGQLSSQLSTAGATPQVESLARTRLGLVPAAPEQMTYVELEPGR
jgi:hypothetical protein